MIKNIFLLSFFFLSSYTNYSSTNCSPDIVIEYSQSYKFDLKNEIYSVYYMNKPPTKIKFHLSTIERRLIEKKSLLSD